MSSLSESKQQFSTSRGKNLLKRTGSIFVSLWKAKKTKQTLDHSASDEDSDDSSSMTDANNRKSGKGMTAVSNGSSSLEDLSALSAIAIPTGSGRRRNPSRSRKTRSGDFNMFFQDGTLSSDQSEVDNSLGAKVQSLNGPLNPTKQDLKDNAVESGAAEDYHPTCYFISKDGSRCQRSPVNTEYYCQAHLCQRKRAAIDQDGYDKDHDKWYFGENGIMRCRALTCRRTRCKSYSIHGFDMCRMHLKKPPTKYLPLLPTMVTNEIAAGEQKTLPLPSKKTIHEDDMFGDISDYSINSDGSIDDSDKESPFHPSISAPSLKQSLRANQRSTNDEDLRSNETGSEDSLEKTIEFDHSKDVQFRSRNGFQQCMFVSRYQKRCPYRRKDKTLAVYCHGHDVLTPRVENLLDRKMRSTCQKNDDSSDSDSASSEISSEESEEVSSCAKLRPYTHKEFIGLWKKCEEFYGEKTDDIEQTKQVRSANQSMCPDDTDGQAKAQYGRLLPRAMKRMIHELLQLQKSDVFLDIGHGIGNTCMHAAFTVGCEARGIEVVFSRNEIANSFKDNILIEHEKNNDSRIVGKISFRHGRLEDQVHREFLTKGVTKAYVNNFNGVFAERSIKNNSLYFLDDYCAGIFALMAPGSVMITLHPLSLGPSLEEAIEIRKKHRLPQSQNASFFSVEQIELGKACDTVKWNKKSGNENLIYVYKYTRLSQPHGESAVFVCSNPRCSMAKDTVPLPAVTANADGRYVIARCNCGFTAKNLRRKKKISYT